MFNSVLFLFAAIPAILYNRASLSKLYETYVKLGMNLQELSQVLHVNPLLKNTTGADTDSFIETFEYEYDKHEKYIMIFKNGKLNKWYLESDLSSAF